MVLSRNESRQIDRLAIDQYGFSSLVLMENAGRGVVDTLERLGIAGPVVILCGKGNNAGDGFVVARHLEIRGYDCRVVLVAQAEELQGDARANYEILTKTDVQIVSLETLDDCGADADWLVDALLGTGATGDPRPPLASVIEWFNAQAVRKLAIDVPSGLDCDTGAPGNPTIHANHTCTFVASKTGYATESARQYTGEIHVLDIGTPPRLVRELVRR